MSARELIKKIPGLIRQVESLCRKVVALEGSGGEVNTVNSVLEGEPQGASTINNIVSISRDNYNTGDVNPLTLYLITDE